MPKQWYNLRADMKEKPDPRSIRARASPLAEQDLYPIFCESWLIRNSTMHPLHCYSRAGARYHYTLCRPSPLCPRVQSGEKTLDTGYKIYYKFAEATTPPGSLR